MLFPSYDSSLPQKPLCIHPYTNDTRVSQTVQDDPEDCILYDRINTFETRNNSCEYLKQLYPNFDFLKTPYRGNRHQAIFICVKQSNALNSQSS